MQCWRFLNTLRQQLLNVTEVVFYLERFGVSDLEEDFACLSTEFFRLKLIIDEFLEIKSRT